MRDAESFDDFYHVTSPRVLRYAHALTGDFAEAQDLVQEAYIRAWQRWRTISAYEHPESWVRLVVARLVTDSFRRRTRGRRAMARIGVPDPERGPSEDSVALIRALRELPLTVRQAVVLHYLCDLPIADIAAEMDIATGTVKSWLFRGRAALAVALDARLPEVTDAA